MAPAPLRLDPQVVEAIALRVAELLDRRDAGSAPELVDASELARRLGTDREWVYAHASELGAVRLGSGSKPRLRFDPEVAIERMRQKSECGEPAPKDRSPRRRRRNTRVGGVPLLPIKGDRSRPLT